MSDTPPWEDARTVALGKRLLRQRAARRGYWTYGELGAELGLDMGNPRDRGWMSGLLGNLSDRDVRKGRPMISVIVGRAEDLYPGAGFFEAARALGRMRADAEPESFWREELEAVWAYWSEAAKRAKARREGEPSGGGA